ncbi:MAG TPA: molybdopterin-dependent oxidoreductase [Pirellulales bacterium]|jgi:hypothetical protein
MKTTLIFLLGVVASLGPVALDFAADEAKQAPAAATGAVTAVTPRDQLAGKVGQVCVVDLRVTAVKHSERRKTRYLNAASNFRSQRNVGVAIDEAAFDRFRAAGIEDLEAKYLNQTIRVRGEVFRDEEQLLIKATSPKEIEIVAADTPKLPAGRLTIVNEAGKEISFALPLGEAPRQKVEVEHNGVKETYEGLSLSDLLERAEIKLGAEARGELVSRYALVTAADKYSAVLAISEIDPFLSPQTILLADRVNGAPLPEADGPLKLIVPNDKRHRRWVRQVVKIEIRQANDKERAVQPAAVKPK